MPRTQVPEEGQRVQNINELKDLKPRPEAVIRTEGAASRNDGLSNLYWWDPNGVATNANGTTIISSNVSGYTSGDPDEGVWRRMFKPSSEIESQIEKSAGNQGAVQYSDGSGGFLGDASYLYVDDSNGTVGIGTSSPNTSVALEIAGTTEISNNTIQGNGGNLNLVEPYLNAFGGGKYGFNSNGDPVIKDASNDTRYVANDNGATVLTNGNVQVADSLSVGQTSSPSFTLDVNGNANISLNLNVGGDATVSGALNVQDFTFDQDSGDLVLSDSNGVELIRQPKGGPTQFVQGAEIGSIETPEDSLTQVINAASTSAASSGDVVGYTFAVDNQSVLEVKADADGSGGITNKRVTFSSGVEFGGAGDGLVSNNGNLDVRLPISDGATPVANVYAFNFGTDINVRDDGGNQVTVEHANTGAADSSNTLPTVIRSVSTDGRGHVTSLSTGTFNDGTDINISGNTINHANTGSDQSTGNSGGTFIQSVSTDGRGHVDSVSSNTFSAGDGLNLSGTTFNARIAVQEGGTGVGSGAYLFNFGNQLNVNDDGSNQVSVSVNDGGGSGLDADTLDGIEGSNYARTDIAETFNDEVYFTGGNVGIGTSSPSSLLDIQDFIHLGTGLDAQDATGNILLGDYFGQATFKIAGAGGPSTDYFYMSPETANQFEIQSGGNLVVRAEDNQNFLVGGNVGIGTTSPNAKLDISNGDVYLDNNQEIKWGGGGNSPRIIDDPGFIGTGDDFIIDGVSDGSNGRQVGFRSDRGFYFLDENNNQLVNIDSGGNVGIGTNSPNQPLDVEGAADLNGRLNMRGNDVINVNTLNLSNVTSNNGSSHIDWTQPVHFNNDSGNNENYVARFSKNGASKPAILTEDIQIDDFTFDQDSGDLVLSDNNGVELIRQPKAGPTQFIQGAEIGSIEAPTDSFTQVINAPSTSAAASGDLVGYTFAVDNQSILEVKADADGSGGITNKRVDFPGDVEFGGAGDGLVSSGGNLDVRLPITDGGSPVANVFQFNIGGALEALDDGGNQTTIRHNNTSSQGNVSTGGATVIDDINVDGYGHVTNMNTQNRRLSDWLVPTSDLNISDENLDNVGNLNVSSINSNNGSSPVNVTQGFDMNNNFIDNVGRFRTESSNPHPLNIHGGNQTSYFDDSENHIYITQSSHPDTNDWGSMVLQSTNSKGWIMLATSNGSSPETKVRVTDGGNADFDLINGTDLDLNNNNINAVNNIRVDSGSIIGISGGPEIEFEGNGLEVQGVERLSFGDQNGNDGLDMNGYQIVNVGDLDVNGNTIVGDLDVNGLFETDGRVQINVESTPSVPSDGYRMNAHYTVTNGNTSTKSNYFSYIGTDVQYGTYNSNEGFFTQGSYPRSHIDMTALDSGGLSTLSGSSPWRTSYLRQYIIGDYLSSVNRVQLQDFNTTWVFGVDNNYNFTVGQDLYVENNVGIGTTSPSYDLEVSGTSSMNRLNLKNQESAGSDGDVIRDNSVGFIGKWGSNTQAVFWDSNNVSTGSNLTVNGGLGQESQPDISIVNNPQFDGSQIGFGNDPDVLVYEDSNNASGPYWNNKDKLEIRGDGSVSGIELEAGYMHATQAAHVSGPIKVDDEVNFSGSFNVEYNSNSESLDFIYTG